MFLRYRKNILIIGFFIAVYAGFYIYNFLPRQYLEVDFLNVGQGDSALIKTPKGENIIIDGGPDNSIIYELGKTLSFFDRTIDLLVLTHPHPDHLSGLLEVLKRFKVKKVLFAAVDYNLPAYAIFQDFIKDRRIEILPAPLTSEINLGENLAINFYYPKANDPGDLNEASIVSRLNFGKINFLFTGDVYEETEKDLLKQNLELEAEILKVAHHGSKTSTNLEFLQNVKPELAVISVGENTFGHPAFKTLKRLEKQKAEVLTTKERGTIRVFSDGQKWWTKSNNK